MRLYRIDFHSADEGAIVAWASSKKDAADVRRDFLREYGAAQGKDAITSVEVPTDKAGLIDWLNVNLTRDNG